MEVSKSVYLVSSFSCVQFSKKIITKNTLLQQLTLNFIKDKNVYVTAFEFLALFDSTNMKSATPFFWANKIKYLDPPP